MHEGNLLLGAGCTSRELAAVKNAESKNKKKKYRREMNAIP